MTENKLKVLIVDDSRFYRSIISKALENDPEIEIIGSVWNGLEAISFIQQQGIPDIVTLDIEMPELDGIETLKQIMEFNRSHPDLADIGVIMVSSVSLAGAEITLNALQIGAFDFVTKVSHETPEQTIEHLRSVLLHKIRSYGAKKTGQAEKTISICRPYVNNPGTALNYQAILIGVSTGGPEALHTLLPELTGHCTLPIFIVQHMPAVFTEILARNLNKVCENASVMEAAHMDVVKEGGVYLAPGGKHLLIKKSSSGNVVTFISDNPPENGLKPSVDVMLRSAFKVYGGNVIAIIMTGMGSDGTRGLRPLKKEGAYVIAQDESSSVVWGMPRNAVAAGFVDSVLPLDRIALQVKKLLQPGYK